MLQSAWVADLFTAEEVDLIRATPALERLHNEADDDDHLLNALTRVLPLALNNIARLAAAVLQIDLDTASTSPDSMKRHIRGAVYEIHRVHDRLTALDVVQCDVAVMPVEIVDRYVVDHLVSAARTVGCIAAGATNMASIRTACDIANASVKGRATSPSRRVMWCNYAVLFARRFATLDLCSSRFDRALFMTRRLRNGFDWHDDCDRRPFCRVRTPFLVQHWCTRSSGGGCPNRKIQSLQHDLWASLESLLGASASLTLVQAAKRNAACWPKEEDIAWCKPRSLAMRLVLGGQLESQEIPGLGWLPTDIDREYANLSRNPDRCRLKLREMLRCSADRLMVQSVCELWLRCVHDARRGLQSPRAVWRRMQLAAPSRAGQMSQTQRESLRMHFCKRLPHYTDECATLQREHCLPRDDADDPAEGPRAP